MRCTGAVVPAVSRVKPKAQSPQIRRAGGAITATAAMSVTSGGSRSRMSTSAIPSAGSGRGGAKPTGGGEADREGRHVKGANPHDQPGGDAADPSRDRRLVAPRADQIGRASCRE